MVSGRPPRLIGIITVLAACVVAFGASAPLLAQTWVPVGPPGGDVRSLASDPTHPGAAYLGTADGLLWRSADGGRTWQLLRPGFPVRGMSLDDLIIAPDGTLYVGFWQVRGQGGGVARSRDGGRTFERLPGIDGEAVRALALAPGDPRSLAAGTPDGVFLSRDGGDSWSRASPIGDEELRNIDSLAFDPGDALTVYAGTWHLPWKTTDGGASWHPVKAGMIDDSDVMTLTVDPISPRTLYATACSGIYRSQDAGGRWAKLRGIPSSSRRTRAFALARDRPTTLYAGTTEGLWLSDDGGASWSQRTSRDTVVNAVLILPGGRVLLGTDGAGVLRSDDGGSSFAASNEGFSGHVVADVRFDPIGERVLAAIRVDRQHSGVLAAPTPEGPWSRLAPGLEGREVLTLSPDPDRILAGTDDGVFALDRAASAWRRLPTVVGGSDCHPRVSQIATAGSLLLIANGKGLLRSTDGGQRFERILVGLGGAVDTVALGGRGGSIGLVSTAFGIFRSSDEGRTWTQVAGPVAEATVQRLSFLPGSESVAFAATHRGLFRTEDAGGTWFPRGGGLPLLDITGLAFDAEGRTILASEFSAGGVWRSRDEGLTWEALPRDGLLSERVWTVAIDPRDPNRLLAAAAAGGIHLYSPSSTAPAAGTPALGGR